MFKFRRYEKSWLKVNTTNSIAEDVISNLAIAYTKDLNDDGDNYILHKIGDVDTVRDWVNIANHAIKEVTSDSSMYFNYLEESDDLPWSEELVERIVECSGSVKHLLDYINNVINV